MDNYFNSYKRLKKKYVKAKKLQSGGTINKIINKYNRIDRSKIAVLRLFESNINYEEIRNDKNTELFILNVPDDYDYKKLISKTKCDNMDVYKTNGEKGYCISIKNKFKE